MKIEIESVSINLSQLIIGHYSKLMEVNKFAATRLSKGKVIEFFIFMKISTGISRNFLQSTSPHKQRQNHKFLYSILKNVTLSLMRF